MRKTSLKQHYSSMELRPAPTATRYGLRKNSNCGHSDPAPAGEESPVYGVRCFSSDPREPKMLEEWRFFPASFWGGQFSQRDLRLFSQTVEASLLFLGGFPIRWRHRSRAFERQISSNKAVDVAV